MNVIQNYVYVHFVMFACTIFFPYYLVQSNFSWCTCWRYCRVWWHFVRNSRHSFSLSVRCSANSRYETILTTTTTTTTTNNPNSSIHSRVVQKSYFLRTSPSPPHALASHLWWLKALHIITILNFSSIFFPRESRVRTIETNTKCWWQWKDDVSEHSPTWLTCISGTKLYAQKPFINFTQTHSGTSIEYDERKMSYGGPAILLVSHCHIAIVGLFIRKCSGVNF